MSLIAIAVQGSPHRGGYNSKKGKAHTAPRYRGELIPCASCGKLAHSIAAKLPKKWKRVNVLRVVCDRCSSPGATPKIN